MKALLQGALTLALALMLVSCGYHLAGSGEDAGRLFSPVLKRVSVEGLGRYESLRTTLVSMLRSYGIRVVSPRQASARLIFSDRRRDRRTSAVGDDVKSREYVLFSEVDFSVVSGEEDAPVLLTNQTVRAQAGYLANPDRPLQDESERRAVTTDIERELCRKIVLRLTTVGT